MVEQLHRSVVFFFLLEDYTKSLRCNALRLFGGSAVFILLALFYPARGPPDLRVKRMIHFPFLAFLFNFLLFLVVDVVALELFLFPRIERNGQTSMQNEFPRFNGRFWDSSMVYSAEWQQQQSGRAHFMLGVGLGFLFAFRPTANWCKL